jgi:hypothetical protein
MFSKLFSINAFLLFDLLADCIGHELHALGYFCGSSIPLGLSSSILSFLLSFSLLSSPDIFLKLPLQLRLFYLFTLCILFKDFSSFHSLLLLFLLITLSLFFQFPLYLLRVIVLLLKLLCHLDGFCSLADL